MLSLWSGMTPSLPGGSIARTRAKYKDMNCLWDLLRTMKQPEEPRETKHTGEKLASQGALSQ